MCCLRNINRYWTEFHPVLPNPDNTTALHAWARDNVVFLETLVVGHNMSNLEYFCFTNEEEGLNPRGNNTAWIAYAEAMRAALDVQGGAVANIKLVGTDYYPCDSAINGIANISAIDSYCCHNCKCTYMTRPHFVFDEMNVNVMICASSHQRDRTLSRGVCERWIDTDGQTETDIKGHRYSTSTTHISSLSLMYVFVCFCVCLCLSISSTFLALASTSPAYVIRHHPHCLHTSISTKPSPTLRSYDNV
jgi:hypothetical protein